MKGLIALFILSLWLIWFFHLEKRVRPAVSSSAWIVLVWIIIHSTRTVSAWLGLESPSSRDEGSPFDAVIELVLMILATIVLFQRGIKWSRVVSDNKWLFVFYLFWFASITWSDYPFITFKRVFKDSGNVLMALVILTEIHPWESIKAVLVRTAYLSVPLSIVLIRYYPEWGRTNVGYHHDLVFLNGVATHKNMLGIIVFVSAMGLLWEILESAEKRRNATERLLDRSNYIVLGMCWYLLFIIDSASSLVAGAVGSLAYFILGRPAFRKSPHRMDIIAGGSACLAFVLDLLFNIKEAFVVEVLGRNMTLTSRTDMWQIVDDYLDNPLVGAGFNTFWTGHRLLLLPEHLRGNVQAHNGYVELYLNGGMIGAALLAGLLVTAFLRLRKKLVLGMLEDRARFAILLSAIVHNYTEASFTKIGILWFVTILAIMEYRERVSVRESGRRYKLEDVNTVTSRELTP